MGDNNYSIESLNSNEVLSALWNKNSIEKCRIGIADCVVYELGTPVRWYLTGKTGEVTKKRGVDMSLVSQRWMKIKDVYDSNVVAIVRQPGGYYKFLSEDAWLNFYGDTTKDPSILSLHCFIRGENHTVFRNKFKLKDKTGRYSSSTHTYIFNLDTIESESVAVMSEEKLRFTECRANHLKNIMDLATHTVVKYLEMMLGVKMMSLTIDYVVDKKSQLWMLWSHEATFIRTDHLLELNIPQLPKGDKKGRMEWAGPKYFEGVEGKEDDMLAGGTGTGTGTGGSSRALSPDKFSVSMKSSRGGGGSAPPFPLTRTGSLSNMDANETALASAQVNEATNIVKINDRATVKRKQKEVVPHSYTLTPLETTQVSSSKTDNFPQPFKCTGDYCNFLMSGLGDLSPNVKANPDLHVATKLFSDKEILQLRKDKKFGQMMEFGAVGPALAAISKKNLILARQEKRGLNVVDMDPDAWKKYPNSPRSKISFVDPDQYRPAALRNGGGMDDTQLRKEQVLEHDKEQRESFTKSMANYYDEVRVCGVCHNIYTCLNWARDILGQGDAYGAGREGTGAAFPKAGKSQQRARSRHELRDGETRQQHEGTEQEHLQALQNWDDQNKTKKDREKEYKKKPSYAQDTSASVSSQAITSLAAKREPRSRNRDGDSLAGGGSSEKKDRSVSPAGRTGSQSPDSRRRSRKGGARSGESSQQLNADGSRKLPTWRDHMPKDKILNKQDARIMQQSQQSQSQSQDGTAPNKGQKFVVLDDYLRGGNEAVVSRKIKEQKIGRHTRPRSGKRYGSTLDMDESIDGGVHPSTHYLGQILLACSNDYHGQTVFDALEEAHFEVHWVRDGREALNDFLAKENGYDCVIVEKYLPLRDAFGLVAAAREHDRELRSRAAATAASEGRGVQPITKRHPVICFTDETTPADLKKYMQADMDGCVSFPVNPTSLLNTVRAAVPHHLALLSTVPSMQKDLPSPDKNRPEVFHLAPLGVLEGSQDSSTRAAKTLPQGTSTKLEADIAINGIVQIDADTRLPFMVLDASRSAKVVVSNKRPFFNLVVCHDLFDTAERMKIFFRPIVERYLGMQILCWNYPGQAFTEWRKEQLLNNEYLSTCLNEVLGQVGEKGTNDFDTTRPFYIMGFGMGASIATFYSSHYRVPNLRSIITVNGWTYLDSYLAGIMHDCINIFGCSPPSRPDLPVYFFSRFLFSKEYLAKVSVPLALNLYTAVHNSISLQGRLALCKGVLQLVDTRTLLKEIDVPIICMQSTQDAIARPLHTEPMVNCRAGEVRSIYKVLKNPHKTCVVWMKGGHEVFQENKKQMQLVLEQILTGFHESHDVSFPSAPTVDPSAASQGRLVSHQPWEPSKSVGRSGDRPMGSTDPVGKEQTVEDKFINNILGSIDKLAASNGIDKAPRSAVANNQASSAAANNNMSRSVSFTAGGNNNANSLPYINGSGSMTSGGFDNTTTMPMRTTTAGGSAINFSATDPAAWQQFSEKVMESSVATNVGKKNGNKSRKKLGHDSDQVQRIIDPSSALFERQDSVVYGKLALEMNHASKQDIHEFPEVKEYMDWRLKRNKKRLQRLQGAARVIQGSFRAYIARKFVNNIRRYKASIVVQRVFRGWLGRCAFQRRARKLWATQVMQRAWRGYLGRKWYFLVRLRIASATTIQRHARGRQGRQRVNAFRRLRFLSASTIQAMVRRAQARKAAWLKRLMRNAATLIQRIFRGLLGRKRAAAERDKYIFSRSQSQGIEFGRQMLLEHKLHATRLQSDVTLLTQEKVGAEEQVEALLEEISGFEEGVRSLEKEMHQLSKVEAEAAAFMDEDSKFELREQKIKLDKEFSEMLNKISNRKDMLQELEKKLSKIDKSRQNKEEELRTLERKLVVLLEEQQNELAAIKKKQDVRGAMLAASHEELMKVAAAGGGGGGATARSTGSSTALTVPGGGGGGGGPSLQEKKQAAQLMQSTETLMKFGFMSMSMTYFSSLNMIKALRTVSAQDTVMAALADVHAQRAVGHGGAVGDDASGSDAKQSGGAGGRGFMPSLKSGQVAGQQVLRVSSWSVDDVAKWLQTLSLGQYAESFIDAAIDGEFLYDINDDDLKNTLGIQHRLHRKKILNCVHRLKLAEAQKDAKLNDLLRDNGGLEAPSLAPDVDPSQNFPLNPFQPNEKGLGGSGDSEQERRINEGPSIPITEIFSLVRHSKFSAIKDAIDYLPNKTFDKTLVENPWVEDFGTVYTAGYERLLFHSNKIDEFGNTMLGLACQNGNAKICKYLLAKGANPNHQNKTGQTPAHFAIAYKFFDLATWLFENGADDTIKNHAGLTPYDGLDGDGDEEEAMQAIANGEENF